MQHRKKNTKKKQDHEYEFLDLSDVDDKERTRLSSALLQHNDVDDEINGKFISAALNDAAGAGRIKCRSRATGNECRRRIPANNFLHANPKANANNRNSWPDRVTNGKPNSTHTQTTKLRNKIRKYIIYI